MRLRIWVEDHALSPDSTDPAIYLDLDLDLDQPLAEVQRLAMELGNLALERGTRPLPPTTGAALRSLAQQWRGNARAGAIDALPRDVAEAAARQLDDVLDKAGVPPWPEGIAG